ncbi:hypothetical protein M885DRAFT_575846 [Pelagophyceae sp. CCMP2097]|nr:hypothetical protein M885DRAFT_575846 [Pelagophyceae sp. CCMP2097]
MGPTLPASGWKGVGVYNDIRIEYCLTKNCAEMRGKYVPGNVVRVRDSEILETWRCLAPGTYVNDVDAIVEESLRFNNLEVAGF